MNRSQSQDHNCSLKLEEIDMYFFFFCSVVDVVTLWGGDREMVEWTKGFEYRHEEVLNP